MMYFLEDNTTVVYAVNSNYGKVQIMSVHERSPVNDDYSDETLKWISSND